MRCAGRNTPLPRRKISELFNADKTHLRLELVAALVEDEVVRRDAPRAARLRRRWLIWLIGRRRRWFVLGAVDDEVLRTKKRPSHSCLRRRRRIGSAAAAPGA